LKRFPYSFYLERTKFHGPSNWTVVTSTLILLVAMSELQPSATFISVGTSYLFLRNNVFKFDHDGVG
jgi:hypothetical protein